MPSAFNLLNDIQTGKFSAIARGITLVENELGDYENLLFGLQANPHCRVVGITGPPGAGKSTLVNALLKKLASEYRIAILSVDPSSPFNYGALLGDRIRMSEFYLNDHVFIRSMASRGSLGGLCPGIIEVTELLRSAPFDYLFIETVGVGQSEVEISGLADTTIVVMVPEAGDEIQTMKAGVMEIADVFVVNKADHSRADEFIRNLKLLAHEKQSAWEIPVIKSVATNAEGIDEIIEAINSHKAHINSNSERRIMLLSEKVYQLIQKKRMASLDKQRLVHSIQEEIKKPHFNLFQFASRMA